MSHPANLVHASDKSNWKRTQSPGLDLQGGMKEVSVRIVLDDLRRNSGA